MYPELHQLTNAEVLYSWGASATAISAPEVRAIDSTQPPRPSSSKATAILLSSLCVLSEAGRATASTEEWGSSTEWKGSPTTPVDGETRRWLDYLQVLKGRVRSGEVTAQQEAQLLAIVSSDLRRPAVGASEDGVLEVEWSFVDQPSQVFTVEIHPSGGIEWFFRDAARGIVDGSDDDLLERLPPHALRLLLNAFGTRGQALG